MGRVSCARARSFDFIAPMPVRAVPGVGPATEQRLMAIGVYTVQDLREASRSELIRQLGQSSGEGLAELAWARDPRRVQASREAKSISTEDTFRVDLTDPAQLAAILRRDAAQVSTRLAKAGLFARTVNLKVRTADFTTITKAYSLGGATDSPDTIARAGLELLSEVDVRPGVRLLGIGVSNFATAGQEVLFDEFGPSGVEPIHEVEIDTSAVRGRGGFYPGADVIHAEHGRGWVWGSGRGRVTVRFEHRDTGPGPVRTFAIDDENLATAPIHPLPLALPEDGED